MIAAIFAIDTDFGIGKNGTLPWPKNSEDLKWFRQHTTGHVVVMGKNTWADPLMPKPLPNRVNAVVSSTAIEHTAIHHHLKGDLSQCLKELEHLYPEKTIFVIGGASIIAQTMNSFDRIYITRFQNDYQCDTKVDLSKLDLYYKLYVM